MYKGSRLRKIKLIGHHWSVPNIQTCQVFCRHCCNIRKRLCRRMKLRTPDFIWPGYWCGICVYAKCLWLVESEIFTAVSLKKRVLQFVAVSGTRRVDGSCCFHLDQAQRWTVRASIIFGSTEWNVFHVTLWQLQSWCCFCICAKFMYRYLSVLFIYFASYLLYVEQAKA